MKRPKLNRALWLTLGVCFASRAALILNDPGRFDSVGIYVVCFAGYLLELGMAAFAFTMYLD